MRWTVTAVAVSLFGACAYAVHDLRSEDMVTLQVCVEKYPQPAAWICEQALFSQHPTPQELTELSQRAGALFAVHQTEEEHARRFLKHYIAAGVDVNAVDKRHALGWTALHSMVLDPDVSAVRVLIEHGASASIPDAKGQTALDLARGLHAKDPSPTRAEVVRLLEQAEKAVGKS